MRWLQKLFGKSAPAPSAPATPAMKSAPPGLAVNWPYPLITVRGAEAPAILAEMATASAGRSWPVLLGAPDELDMLSQDMSPDVSTEQYYYAPDIVEQGTETISRLSAILLVSDFWYFWWD